MVDFVRKNGQITDGRTEIVGFVRKNGQITDRPERDKTNAYGKRYIIEDRRPQSLCRR